MQLKKLTAIILAILLCFVSVSVSAADWTDKIRTIQSHTYNIADVTLIQRIAAGLQTATEEQRLIYDLDFNFEINIMDATTVQMHCAHVFDVTDDAYLNQFVPTEPTTAATDPTEPATEQPPTEEIFLSLHVGRVKMGLNETFTLVAETNALSVTFRSTDESVLTVNSDGVVTPKKTGQASVVCDTGCGVTARCSFEVCLPATQMRLNRDTLYMGVSEYFVFQCVLDEGAAACQRHFTSDNPEVISIDPGSGYASAVGVGETIIRCTLENGLSASCFVEVYRMAQELTLNEKQLTIAVGEQFDFDSHVVGGGYAYIRTYHSLRTDVATIALEGGLLTAQSIGETRIYCELINGVRAYADVTVVPALQEISLVNTPSQLQVGEHARFRVNGNTSVDNTKVSIKTKYGLVKATAQGTDYIELTGVKQGVDTVTVTAYNGLSQSFSVKVEGSCAVLIDVSTWQGDIDFERVRQSGIDYVIIRAGFGREWYQIDDCFVSNYNKAKAAGLKVGVYWFSYSESADEAFEEAKACLYCLGGRKLDLPVYYDLEYDPAMYRMSQYEYTQMALNFCYAIERAGYRPGVYSSVSVYQSKLNHALLMREGVSIWNAHWASRCTIKCDIWQYSENGSVSGIYGDVDMNLIYNLNNIE